MRAFPKTIKAVGKYFLEQGPALDQKLNDAMTNKAVLAVTREREDVLDDLRQVFLSETADLNTWSHVKVMSASDIRDIVSLVRGQQKA